MAETHPALSDAAGSRSPVTRRRLLGVALALPLAAPLIAACGAPAAAPTAAPKAAEATKPAALAATTAPAAATKPVAAATTAPAAPAATTKPAAAAATAAPAASGTPRRGGRLIIGQMGDIGDLDPHSFAFVNYGHIAQVYNRLAAYDKSLKLQPELAERWELSGDGLLLKLTLRQGVKFHNGREFVADDVVANFEKAQNKDTGGHLYPATQSVASVKATGKHAVEIAFKTPTPEMYDMLSRMSIIAPESFKDIKKAGIGTGPFKFVEWVPVDRVVLRRFDDYWEKDKPALDEVTIKPYNDQAAMQIALQSGTIQAAIGIPYKDAKRLSGELQIITGQPGATWYTLYASAHSKPFDNQKVRKAMQYAVNRKLIVDSVLFGYGEAVWSPWPKTSIAHDPKWENIYPFDLEKAKALIAEAGYPNGFEAEIIAPTSFPELGDMALVLQADLAKIGVRLKTANLGAEWGQRLGKGEYNLTFSFAGRSHLDPVSAFDNSAFRHVSNPLFPEGKTPAGFAEAVTAAKTTLDTAKRKEALTRATDILLEESFAMSVSWRYTLFGAGSKVKGFDYTPDDFVVLKNTWLEG